MSTLRILVTGRTEHDLVTSLHRATAAVAASGDDLDATEVVVLSHVAPRSDGTLWRAATETPGVELRCRPGALDARLLDVGLFARPLPTAVAVLGDSSSWALDAALITPALVGAGVGAVVPAGACDRHLSCLLHRGGVFAAGPLTVAGGFAGPGSATIRSRLHRVGYATLELPATPGLSDREHTLGDSQIVGAIA